MPERPEDLTPEVEDAILEEVFGQPAQPATAAGIAAVERRIASLQTERAKLEAQKLQHPGREARYDAALADCDADLRRAQNTLTFLQRHFQARN